MSESQCYSRAKFLAGALASLVSQHGHSNKMQEYIWNVKVISTHFAALNHLFLLPLSTFITYSENNVAEEILVFRAGTGLER